MFAQLVMKNCKCSQAKPPANFSSDVYKDSILRMMTKDLTFKGVNRTKYSKCRDQEEPMSRTTFYLTVCQNTPISPIMRCTPICFNERLTIQ